MYSIFILHTNTILKLIIKKNNTYIRIIYSLLIQLIKGILQRISGVTIQNLGSGAKFSTAPSQPDII